MKKRFKLGMRGFTALLMVAAILAVVALLTFIAASYFNAEAEKNMVAAANARLDLVEATLDANVYSRAEELNSAVSAFFDLENVDLEAAFLRILDNSTFAEALSVWRADPLPADDMEMETVYALRENGVPVVSKEKYKVGNIRSEKWFSIPLSAGKRYVTPVFEWNGARMVTIATPIRKNGSVVAVSCVDVRAETFEEILADFPASTPVIMLGPDFTISTHADKSLLGKNLFSAIDTETRPEEIGDRANFAYSLGRDERAVTRLKDTREKIRVLKI